MLKVRAEMNERGIRQMKENQETKTWLFEKTNEIEKLPASAP